MGHSILRRWIVIGVIEIVVALTLAAIAPTFINSHMPILGLLIWLMILGMVGFSGGHVIWHWHQARQARRLWVRRFPQYRYLTTVDFLTFSPHQVAQGLRQLDLMQSDPDFQSLDLSPLEFLCGIQP
jgi:hypothetical protein